MCIAFVHQLRENVKEVLVKGGSVVNGLVKIRFDEDCHFSEIYLEQIVFSYTQQEVWCAVCETQMPNKLSLMFNSHHLLQQLLTEQII